MGRRFSLFIIAFLWLYSLSAQDIWNVSSRFNQEESNFSFTSGASDLDSSSTAIPLYLKTNGVEWSMLIANLSAEVVVAPQLSLNFPISYSAWDYFKSTLKIRILKLQPEIRYWFTNKNDCFLGFHLGMAYYNLAFDKDFRYQDHAGNTPAWGGGLSFGYRMPISQDDRWGLEFSLGAGVYDAHYDEFINDSNGALVNEVEKTYVGIDQISVSFLYKFNLRKD